RTTDFPLVASGSNHPARPRAPFTSASPFGVLRCARPELDLVDQRLDTCGRLRHEAPQVLRLDCVLNTTSQLLPFRVAAHASIVPAELASKTASPYTPATLEASIEGWSSGVALAWRKFQVLR